MQGAGNSLREQSIAEIIALVEKAIKICDELRLIAVAIDLSMALDKLEDEKN